MKIVSRDGYKFATGLFWQIIDEGRKKVDFNRLKKDTKVDAYCKINLNIPTWGFCSKAIFQGEKNVSSLSKFVIDSSKIALEYSNIIICFRFSKCNSERVTDEVADEKKLHYLENTKNRKNPKSLRENELYKQQDLYGYVLLLNGTICPDDGELVTDFTTIKKTIIKHAQKYEIEALYLPIDVATQFFCIFENLHIYSANDSMLFSIIKQIKLKRYPEFAKFIYNNFPDNSKFRKLLDQNEDIDLSLLKTLMQEESFILELKQSSDGNIRELIPNIIELPLSSEEIYWQEQTIKTHFKSSLLKPMDVNISMVCKLIGIVGFFSLTGFFINEVFFNMKEPAIVTPVVVQERPKAVSVSPVQLINTCVISNNKFFGSLGNWTLNNLNCNSIGYQLEFLSEVDVSLMDLINLVGTRNVSLNKRTGKVTKSFNLPMSKKIKTDPVQVVDKLQRQAYRYDLNLNFIGEMKGKLPNKFKITSNLSPVFLLNHNVFSDVNLSRISMSLNKTNGFYMWVIEGEF